MSRVWGYTEVELEKVDEVSKECTVKGPERW